MSTNPWKDLVPPPAPTAPDDLLAASAAAEASMRGLSTLVGPAPAPAPAAVQQIKITPSADQEAALDKVWGIIQAVHEGTYTSDPVVVWVGNAGTGKTTCMRLLERKLASKGIFIEWMAPTGKAAARLRDVLGKNSNVTTIHARLYGAPHEQGTCPACKAESDTLAVSVAEKLAKGEYWQCPDCGHQLDPAVDTAPVVRLNFVPAQTDEDGNVQICAPGAVLCCDEASMVNETTHADIMAALPSGSVLIYLGDDGQVPPVEGKWGPDFENPTVKLTHVHRQAAGSLIIQAATIARTTGDVNKLFALNGPDYAVDRQATMQDAALWAVRQRQQGVDSTLVTYTNSDRQTLNDLVRRGLGLYDQARQQGLPLVAGDRMLITANNHDMAVMNGEVLTVEYIEHHPNVEHHGVLIVQLKERPDTKFYLLAETVGVDTNSFRYHRKKYVRLWERAEAVMGVGNVTEDNSRLDPKKFLCVDYGECLTVHKSQGSQWHSVGFVFGRSLWGMFYRERPTFQRLVYTALTRAAKTAKIFVIKK